MNGQSYPAATVAQMSRIPLEALPRFLAELPEMLATIRQLDAAVAAANEAVGVEALQSIIGDAEWVDDDKQIVTTTVSYGDFAEDAEPLVLRRHFGTPAGDA